jgi:hypothetical protein
MGNAGVDNGGQQMNTTSQAQQAGKLRPEDLWSLEQYAKKRPVQEMLRIERIFEADGISDELAAYNPLIPDGSNWKVTLLIEYPDPVQRKRELALLKGIEDRCWVQVEGHDRVFAIADEDLDRENEEKTSSVHFLRFELAAAMVEAARGGAAISIGMDHEHYRHAVSPLPAAVRDALASDLA